MRVGRATMPHPIFVRKKHLVSTFCVRKPRGGGGKFHLELVFELRLNYSWNLSLRAAKSFSPRSETKTKKPKKHIFSDTFLAGKKENHIMDLKVKLQISPEHNSSEDYKMKSRAACQSIKTHSPYSNKPLPIFSDINKFVHV